MSCFLNTGLQLIWSLAVGRQRDAFEQFMTMPLDNGPTLLRPLIESLIELFKQAAHQYGYVPLLDTVKVRREIFKL